jgi:outer membrane protein assembly factor BamB
MPRRRRRRSRWLPILPWLILPLFGVTLTALELHLRGGLPIRPRAEPERKPEIVWRFQTTRPGAIVSSPMLDNGRVYIGVIRDHGFSPQGVVVAVDDASEGKLVWDFDDGGKMIHMYSSPRIADGRLYIGEGMHANGDCKLYCLDVANGKKLWSFGATSHIESTPCIADGRVVFGAGDDGVYAGDAKSGEKLWQFNEAVHVDGSPAAAGGKVYFASAVSRRHKITRLVCLDAVTGKSDWQLPTDLPCWSPPAIDAGQLFVTLGNGRLTASDPMPAGEILCVDIATHKRLWSRSVPDGIMAGPAVGAEHVYIGCRDGRVYAVNRGDGAIAWSYDAGSPVVTQPALLDGRLYIAASAGRVICLDAADGAERDVFDLTSDAGTSVRLWSSPSVRAEPDGWHRVYVGAELRYPDQHSDAVLYCLRF